MHAWARASSFGSRASTKESAFANSLLDDPRRWVLHPEEVQGAFGELMHQDGATYLSFWIAWRQTLRSLRPYSTKIWQVRCADYIAPKTYADRKSVV